jgi:DNA-binding Lrp family transcriptional regulator
VSKPTKELRMSVHAYVLIQTDVGKAADVTRSIREIEGVVSAEDVTGPYDVIALVASGSIDEVGRLVVSQVQRIEGITRTVTCPVVNL